MSTEMDRQALDETLGELSRIERGELTRLGLCLVRCQDLVRQQDALPVALHPEISERLGPLVGVVLAHCVDGDNTRRWMLEHSLSELRASERSELETLSTFLTMQAATLVRVSTHLSSGLILAARILYVLAHEDQRG